MNCFYANRDLTLLPHRRCEQEPSEQGGVKGIYKQPNSLQVRNVKAIARVGSMQSLFCIDLLCVSFVAQDACD